MKVAAIEKKNGFKGKKGNHHSGLPRPLRVWTHPRLAEVWLDNHTDSFYKALLMSQFRRPLTRRACVL